MFKEEVPQSQHLFTNTNLLTDFPLYLEMSD